MDRSKEISSIDQKFNNISKCDICFNNYNRTDKQPVIICSMHHTICRQCMASLEHKPNCPFCREKIRFDKVVVNNYINELLPVERQEEMKPNKRTEVTEKSPILGYPAQANRLGVNQYARSTVVNRNSQNEQIMNRSLSVSNFNQRMPRDNMHAIEPIPAVEPPLQLASASINNRPLERVYQQGFDRQPQLHWENMGQGSSQLSQYYCLYLTQIPFTFFNLYFALTSPRSECMDKPHRLTILIVRPWLLSIGIIEVVLMLAFLLTFFLYKRRIIRYQTFQKLRLVIGAMLIIKLLVWLFAQLQLFQASIVKYCSGGVYAYGVVMTILHGLLILTLCVFSHCRSNI